MMASGSLSGFRCPVDPDVSLSVFCFTISVRTEHTDNRFLSFTKKTHAHKMQIDSPPYSQRFPPASFCMISLLLLAIAICVCVRCGVIYV